MESLLSFIAGCFFSILMERYIEYCNRRKQHQSVVINSLKKWLNHHKNGIPIAQPNDEYPIGCPKRAPRDFESYVRQHLEKEAPRALDLVDDSRKMYEDCVKKRQNLLRKVGGLVSRKYNELENELSDVERQHIRNFRNAVIEEVKNRVEYELSLFKPKVVEENRQHVLIFNGNKVAIAENPTVFDKLIDFFDKLVEDKEINDYVREIIRINREFCEKFEELCQIINDVIERFEHGHELKGKCEYCPKFLKVLRC